MILHCYFCCKKIMYGIKKEKKNTTCLTTILTRTIDGVIVAARVRKSKSNDIRRIKHDMRSQGGNTNGAETDNENPQTLVETLDHANPQLYAGIYVAQVTSLTYPLSTCAAERSLYIQVFAAPFSTNF